MQTTYHQPLQTRRTPLSLQVVAAILVVAYLIHGYQVFRTAVDAPFLDDWSLTRWEHLSYQVWLVTLHVDHPLLFTKLLVTLQDLLGAWNVEVHRKINWCLYGAEVLALAMIVAAPAGSTNRRSGLSRSIPTLFCITMLSTFNYLNHEWVIQTSYHLFVLFTLLAALGVQRRGMAAWTLGCLALAAIPQTLASGMLVAALALPIFGWRLWKRCRLASFTRCSGGLLVLVLAVASLGFSVIRYLRSGTGGSFAEAVDPAESVGLFVRLLGLSVTPSSPDFVLGLIVLSTILILGIVLLRQPAPLNRQVLGVLLVLVSAVSFLALVAYGRNLDAIGQNQYAEIQAMVPALLCSLLLAALPNRRLKWLTIGLLGLVVSWGYRGEWRYGLYEERANAIHRQTVECAARGWRGYYPRHCDHVFPPWHDFSTDLDHARRDQTALFKRTQPGSHHDLLPQGFAVGQLETATIVGSRLVLRGWALPEGNLELRSNGRVIHPERIERLARRNLAKRHGVSPDQRIGFVVWVHRDDVPTAELDGVSVLIGTGTSMLTVPPRFYLEDDNAVWADGRRLARAAPRQPPRATQQAARDTWTININPDPPLREEEWKSLTAVGLWRDLFVPLQLVPTPQEQAAVVHWRTPRMSGETIHAVVLLSPQRGFYWIESPNKPPITGLP